MFDELKTAIGELDEDAVLEIIDGVVNGEGDAKEAMEACQAGMDVVGDMFESGDYFVGDLIFAGDLMKNAMEKLKPMLSGDAIEDLGKMILCTVHGDIHDIGKNIVKSIVEAAGFEVVDLGVDVQPETIVKTASEQDIGIVGLSGILTLAVDSMADTVTAFREAGLRDHVKIVIGGNPVTADVCERVGADAWATTPQETTEICRNWAKA